MSNKYLFLCNTCHVPVSLASPWDVLRLARAVLCVSAVGHGSRLLALDGYTNLPYVLPTSLYVRTCARIPVE